MGFRVLLFPLGFFEFYSSLLGFSFWGFCLLLLTPLFLSAFCLGFKLLVFHRGVPGKFPFLSLFSLSFPLSQDLGVFLLSLDFGFWFFSSSLWVWFFGCSALSPVL
ncbi:MAG: hypothetical protein CL799_01910 [Chromatiales bacterium]|nr:hypothetical protein [Chromatiales bacterium]